MKRVWLLDDACDGPKDDWEWKHLWNDYNGLPKEVYRAMSEWAWNKLGASSEFAENNSKTLQDIALEHVREAKLMDEPEQVLAAIHNTSVMLRSGEHYDYEVDADALWDAIQDLELGPSKMLSLPATGGDFQSYFPTKEIALLDMPLIDVEEAARGERAEERSED